MDTSPQTMTSKESPLIGGQLITPRTSYANWGGTFAIDNGAFKGFPAKCFARILERDRVHRQKCLFVTVPDIVGSGRRTLEIFRHRERFKLIPSGWPLALVAQDGMEDLEIPWPEFSCLFVGGLDPWKDSQTAADIVKTAKILGLHVHVGRVNGISRYRHFSELKADSCDGSGVAQYDHMLEKIIRALSAKPECQLELMQ